MPLADPSTIRILRDDRQRRKPEDIDSLVESIRLNGQIQEIVCTEDDGGLTLVAGERRLLACQKLNRKVRYILRQDLAPEQAQIIELEENIRRADLPWRDFVSAIGKIHNIYRAKDATWTAEQTAEYVNFTPRYIGLCLSVHRNLDSPLIAQAQTIDQAYSILQRASERRAASIVGELIEAGKATFTRPPSTTGSLNGPNGIHNSPTIVQHVPVNGSGAVSVTDTSSPIVTNGAAEPPPTLTPPIANLSFIDWVADYTGPKFNFIHCDFPYGVSYEAFANSIAQRGELYSSTEGLYWQLLSSFCTNIDRFVSYSAHVMFWFHMNFYEETRRQLSAAGLWVHNRPLIWYKTDNSGIVPGQNGQFPRWVYETALLCSRGKRPLIRASGDAYGAPIAANAIHPTVKPEPVLRHFLGLFVDETTDMFDPTCGSGTALRAAEDLGARSTFGLEINHEFASAANSLTLRARAMRNMKR